MPVKLANRTLSQMLLSTGDVVATGQVGNHGLAHPATVQDSRLGVGEAPFEVRDYATVGALAPEVVGVL